MTPDEGTAKTTPCHEGSLGDKDLGGNIPPADMKPIHTPVVDPLGTGAKYKVDETQSTRLSIEDELEKETDKEEVLAFGDDMDEDPQDDVEVRTPSPNQTQPGPSYVQESASDSSSPDLKRFDNTFPLTERQLIKYLRKMSRVLFNRITEKQWEQHEEATSIIQVLQAYALKQEEASAAWTKSSTNMAWNLGARMTAIEISQTALKCKVSSLKKDTSEIESMMAEIYQAFKGQPSSAPSGSVTLTLALTYISANVEGENTTNTDTKKPPSHTEGEKEKIKKANEETKLLVMSRLEVIKVVRKEAKKLEIDPKEAISTKAGETFKKAQDAEHESLNKSHPKPQKERGSIWNWNLKSRCLGWNMYLVISHSKDGPISTRLEWTLVSYLVMASMVKTEENA
uniref:Uncharacterized protein n=1 Tax=Tanacetum cinerariifolium TaxID=118510 RepID=A0A6L2MD92_TANCI|nr:hypothetical protein [Tanacetum cinerariifolium]